MYIFSKIKLFFVITKYYIYELRHTTKKQATDNDDSCSYSDDECAPPLPDVQYRPSRFTTIKEGTPFEGMHTDVNERATAGLDPTPQEQHFNKTALQTGFSTPQSQRCSVCSDAHALYIRSS